MKAGFKRSVVAIVLLFALCSIMAFFPVERVRASGRYSGYTGYGEASVGGATETETVYFTRREETYIETVKGVPGYYQTATYPNSCGPVGGAIIVGFYDKYYEDLIPNYTPIAASSGAYKKADRVYVPQLIGELYTLMRTNVDDVGVSRTDCLTGLTAYVQSHGRSIHYSGLLSSNKINESAYVNAISNNHPVLLFCNQMAKVDYSHTSTYETLTTRIYTGDHIVVAYGYLKVDYYNGDDLFRTEKYLKVSSGLGTLRDLFVKLDYNNWCDALYSVTIS